MPDPPASFVLMDLLQRVRRFIRQHDLIRPDARVVAAVSGGSDSVALVHLLREISRTGGLQVAGIVHFNHQLRPTAAAHEHFVHEVAESCGLRIVAGREDVAARAAREHTSVEDAARRARYAFFERARVELAADVIALGHTRDDQAETFLLRLMRGAGPRGLAGMHPRSGHVVRPLLDCRRIELRGWLAERAAAGVPFCGFLEDETNEDVSIPRNRIRHELLPFLAERFNPAIVDVLAHEAALLQDVWAWMEAASAPFLTVAGVLDLEQLRPAPTGLQRLVVWRALSAGAGGREISSDHVASVIRLMQADEGNGTKSLDVPGQKVQRIGSRIVLTGRAGSPGLLDSPDSQGSAGSNPVNQMILADPANPANQFRYSLSIPGKVLISETGWIVSVEPGTPDLEPDRCAAAGKGVVAVVRRDAIEGTLVVRNRRPGDRFRPVGLGGSRKLQDLFVDRKVARTDRDKVPVVVDGLNRIVWVAGYGIDEGFRVTDPSQAVLVLRLTRASLGGAPGWLGGSA